jgi:hypothetical protein
MVIVMLGNTDLINDTVEDGTSGMMAVCMTECFEKISDMDRENFCGRMVRPMKENLDKDNEKGRECTSLVMEDGTKVHRKRR